MNYERVNWENGTEVEEAYVEIDGTRYPVVMPTYNCNTPITARNLNIMDKGIKEASENITEIKRTTDNLLASKTINSLYPNRTGGAIDIIRHPFSLYTPLRLERVGNLVHISGDLKVAIEHTGAEQGWWAFCSAGSDWAPLKETIFNAPISKDNQEITLRIDTDGILSYYVFNTDRYPLTIGAYVRINVTYIINPINIAQVSET